MVAGFVECAGGEKCDGGGEFGTQDQEFAGVPEARGGQLDEFGGGFGRLQLEESREELGRGQIRGRGAMRQGGHEVHRWPEEPRDLGVERSVFAEKCGVEIAIVFYVIRESNCDRVLRALFLKSKIVENKKNCSSSKVKT